MHHVAMEIQEYGKYECQSYPYSRPCSGFLDGYNVRLAVNHQHVQYQYGCYEHHKANQEK